MIVEDEETVRELVAENLRKWGFETVEVTDFMNDCREYARNDQRKILHAKAILRRYGINVE